jgi:hypothetical protein
MKTTCFGCYWNLYCRKWEISWVTKTAKNFLEAVLCLNKVFICLHLLLFVLHTVGVIPDLIQRDIKIEFHVSFPLTISFTHMSHFLSVLYSWNVLFCYCYYYYSPTLPISSLLPIHPCFHTNFPRRCTTIYFLCDTHHQTSVKPVPVRWTVVFPQVPEPACVTHWLLLMQVQEDEYEHVCALVDFALAMKTRLEDVNKHSFNNFYLRVGKLSSDFYGRMGERERDRESVCVRVRVCVHWMSVSMNWNFNRNQLWSSSGWSDWSSQACVRYLGQHSERGISDGLNRYHGSNSGPQRNLYGKNLGLFEVGDTDVDFTRTPFWKFDSFSAQVQLATVIITLSSVLFK